MSETLHFPAKLSRVWRISRVHEPLLIHSLQNQNSTLLIITQYYQNKIYHYGNVIMGIFYVGVVAGFIVRGDTPMFIFKHVSRHYARAFGTMPPTESGKP